MIDSGVGNGESVSWFEVDTYGLPGTDTQATANLEFYVTCPLGNQIAVYVNDTSIFKFPCSGCLPQPPSNFYLVRFGLPTGMNMATIRFEYINYLPFSSLQDSYNCNRAAVRVLYVVGGAVGGASKCADCAPGTSISSNLLHCDLCKPGSFSASTNVANCTFCPVDTFTPFQGQTKCLSCGNGTWTNGQIGSTYWYVRIRFDLRSN